MKRKRTKVKIERKEENKSENRKERKRTKVKIERREREQKNGLFCSV